MPSTLALHCTPHIGCGHYTALARVDGHRPVPSVLAALAAAAGLRVVLNRPLVAGGVLRQLEARVDGKD